ncbi:MAG: tetratricopeptide repeat protein, partial [Planctomycetota bacterium]
MYRLGKFVKRRRGVVIAGSLVLAGLAAGVVGIAMGYVRATDAAALERVAREGEASQRARAQATTNFLHDMLASIDPEKSKGHEVTVREMLDQAAAKVGESLKDDPVAEASLRSTLAQTYHQLSLFDQAATQNARAMEIDEVALGKDDKETLTVKHNLAASWLMLDKVDQARELLDAVYEARVRTLGERSEDALATLSLLGFAAQSAGDLEGALKVYRKTFDAQKESLPGGRKARGSMETLASIADALHGLGRLDEAEKAAAELVADATTATPENGGGLDGKLTLMGLSIRAAILKDLGRLEESERLARETLAAKRRIYGPEHSETLTTQNALAQTLEQLKKYDEAMVLTREAMESSERTRGEIHDTTLSYMGNLARIEQL